MASLLSEWECSCRRRRCVRAFVMTAFELASVRCAGSTTIISSRYPNLLCWQQQPHCGSARTLPHHRLIWSGSCRVSPPASAGRPHQPPHQPVVSHRAGHGHAPPHTPHRPTACAPRRCVETAAGAAPASAAVDRMSSSTRKHGALGAGSQRRKPRLTAPESSDDLEDSMALDQAAKRLPGVSCCVGCGCCCPCTQALE
jgi:hypothetical protein